MTLDDRAACLASAYPFTSRQARFLVLAAAIGGYCLRRQYGAYARIALGKNPAAFLDDVVARGLATRHRPKRHRSYVYHLKNRTLYESTGLGDNRHRRPVPPTRQARRIMLLDFAIAHPTAAWYATEADKVSLFADLGLSLATLPGRIYRSDVSSNSTVRHFVLKQPIFRLPSDPAVHFLYLALDSTGQGVASFLAHHAALLHALKAWRIVLAYPPFIRAAQPRWMDTVRRAHFLLPPRLSTADARELHAYFRVRHALTDGSTESPITIDHLYEQRRRRFAGSAHESLYPYWCLVGGPRLAQDAPPDFSAWRPAGAVSCYELPHRYDLFGSFPGIA